MKRIIALLITLSLVCMLGACGEKAGNSSVASDSQQTTVSEQASTPETDSTASEGDSSSSATPAQTLLADFRERMNTATDVNAEELANALLENEVIQFAPAVMPVEPGFLNGFSSEISGFSEGVMFGPMIGTIPFIGYIFVLDDGTDVETFKQQLKDNADLRWNICTQADELVCDSVGNVVFFNMSPLSFEE
ncbi:MAG: hypothetical protein PUC88_04055 [Clostridia bacterium]|nr:hypothetical protein [Clostridia bacterium]